MLKKSNDGWLLEDSAQPTPAPVASQPAGQSDILTPETKAIMAETSGDKWSRDKFISKLDGHERVIFGMYAKNPPSSSGTSLDIQCGMGAPSVWVIVAAPQNGNVRIAVDDAALMPQKWDEAHDHQFLSPLSTKATKTLVDQLVHAKTFRFEFTPKGKSPELFTFNLLDIKKLLTQEKICKL
jgi:hypothetical protein